MSGEDIHPEVPSGQGRVGELLYVYTVFLKTKLDIWR
jgi:hypothetical protein